MTADRIRELAKFDIHNECGYWEVPIDDLNGELALPEDAARFVGALEAEPIEKHLARILPLLEALLADREALREALRDITAEGNKELAQVCPNVDCDYQAACAIQSLNICDGALAASDARFEKLGE